MTTPYNQLRQLLTDMLPHLKELSFGCEIQFGFSYATIIGKQENGDYQLVKKEVVGSGNEIIIQSPNMLNRLVEKYGIIGRPPTLQDVLFVLSKNPDKTFTINTYGEIAEECHVGERVECTYDLTKPLAKQSDKTLLAIIELIK